MLTQGKKWWVCCYIKLHVSQWDLWIDALLQRLQSSDAELCTVCSSTQNPSGRYLSVKHTASLCTVNNEYGFLQFFMQPVSSMARTLPDSFLYTHTRLHSSAHTSRLRLCSSINISIMYAEVTVFYYLSCPLWDWRQWYICGEHTI